MRIAIGQLWQETNTFNPLPTTQEDFEQRAPLSPVLRGEGSGGEGWRQNTLSDCRFIRRTLTPDPSPGVTGEGR